MSIFIYSICVWCAVALFLAWATLLILNCLKKPITLLRLNLKIITGILLSTIFMFLMLNSQITFWGIAGIATFAVSIIVDVIQYKRQMQEKC